MLNPIAAMLESQPLVVLDGALATELERRGADLRDPLWSAKILLESPDLIRAVHADYFAVGADVAITASYQATFQGFAARGLNASEAADLMRLSVSLAVQARDEFWAVPEHRAGRCQPFVAASVGPYGAFLADGSEYRGDYGLSEAELIGFHRSRFELLATSGADMLALETIPCLVEARALVRLLEDFPGMSAWLSFSAKDGERINGGETLAECVEFFKGHPQIAAIGVNCTAPEFVPDLVAAARALTDTPIMAYPNSGEAYDAVFKRWTGQGSCAAFARQAQTWVAAGARVIGGCCRTTPAHIRELALEWRGQAALSP